MLASPPNQNNEILAADRNLLFGILALQNNFIDRHALVAAFDRWASDQTKPLAEMLIMAGELDFDQRQLLESLVAQHLKLHDNDAGKSLAAVASLRSVHNELATMAELGTRASLCGASARTRDGDSIDPFATRPVLAGGMTILIQRFNMLRPHARGGLGQVSVALDEELRREVAVKEIQERYADDVASRSRFVLEAEVTGGLEHPGIVPVYGLGQYDDGRPFYVMRFIRGNSLHDAIKRFHERGPRERSLELHKLLGRFVDVCDALEYAHSRGVLHRDLKPENIMLGKYGETLVVDWGLAKPMGHFDAYIDNSERTFHPASASGSAPTQMGSVFGTPQFMSPEQAEGQLDRLSRATDVYSLGATLYCLLTGQPPFADGDVWTTIEQVKKGEFPSPCAINKTVPAALEAICLKAMALRPSDRYGSARALADDIEHWLADEPVSAHREPLHRRAARLMRRHKTTTSAVAAALAVLIVGGGLALEMSRKANERTRALDAADALLTANAAAVPHLLRSLRPSGRLTLEHFRECLRDAQLDETQHLLAAYALADQGEAPLDFLLDSIPTAPGDQCRNLVAALATSEGSALPQLAGRAGGSYDTAAKARYAIVAMHLGDPRSIRQLLQSAADPLHRDAIFNVYSNWHGDLKTIVALLRDEDHPDIRSGFCAAIGRIEPESLPRDERNAAIDMLRTFSADAADGPTREAAASALRQWKTSITDPIAP